MAAAIEAALAATRAVEMVKVFMMPMNNLLQKYVCSKIETFQNPANAERTKCKIKWNIPLDEDK